MKIEYSFSKYITDRTSLRLHAMMPKQGRSGIAAANVGLQPTVV